MTKSPSSSDSVFRMLCRVLGGHDRAALSECITNALLPQLFNMARNQDLLPALAVRCNEQDIDTLVFGEESADLLKQALMDNTLRNLEISAQALKFTRQLNRAGITPLFLKGTVRLLTSASESLGFRKQIDIDLIVQPAELEAAGDVFLSDGYRYCHYSDYQSAPRILGDTASASKLSAAHHHLPPLVKTGYDATVELHRHFLDRRFQHANSLEALFSSALQLERHSARFQVPSTEHQIIQLILGKFINDGHRARRVFPLREGCDLIDLLEKAEGDVNQQLVLQHCGRSFALFHALLCELMNYVPRTGITAWEDPSDFIRMMQKRFESPAVCMLLDARARAGYLAHALTHSPAKLPAYVRRILASNQA